MQNNLSGTAHRVEELAQEAPFDAVERYIETLPLDDRRKAALWLLAWSYASRVEQRRIAYEALTEVGS